ncbi:TIR domain protein [Caballeronia peredens]|nr:TIR domain protein [Caballeronia peredens]
MVNIFFSYSHKDEVVRNELEAHLASLRHQGLIESWHDRRITAGDEVDNAIFEKLESANIILLLVSSDFINSSYCYSKEMERAMERHRAGTARVIPIIVRHCDWMRTPFGKLLAAPRDGKPILSWPDRDEALADVARQIREAVEEKWLHSFGQFSEIFKWNVWGDYAADLIAGSVAKYASSGVRSAKLEWGRLRLYNSKYSPMERRAWPTDS